VLIPGRPICGLVQEPSSEGCTTRLGLGFTHKHQTILIGLNYSIYSARVRMSYKINIVCQYHKTLQLTLPDWKWRRKNMPLFFQYYKHCRLLWKWWRKKILWQGHLMPISQNTQLTLPEWKWRRKKFFLKINLRPCCKLPDEMKSPGGRGRESNCWRWKPHWSSFRGSRQFLGPKNGFQGFTAVCLFYFGAFKVKKCTLVRTMSHSIMSAPCMAACGQSYKTFYGTVSK
jgi:hypothetical protein